ncbi:ECF-type sigma factor [Wenzhouxiangella marina]|uniref:ECF-type sigma factor n=1 Tax=Wenzhouxiangella marina TaxID=1579979 RepID=UPI0009E2DD20|nr:ECF-type sigma factor [Wenzhouxiangella marina]MBB6087459.1 RNA polymerase sigma factor (TIGR02999 family) [Wenzhouxiangella marina]
MERDSALDDGLEADSGFERCHAELYRIAQRELRRQFRSGTIDTVALVNEAWLRVQKGESAWQSRGHFLASMTTTMRHVLIDYARERGAQRRGGDWIQVTSSALDQLEGEDGSVDLLAVDRALKQLGERSERQERLLEFKLFGGLTTEEMAEALQISTATVTRDLRMATAFVRRAMEA